MPRLFVAVPLPPDVRALLAARQNGLPGARWADTEQLHCTLRFLGSVDGTRAAEVEEALGTVHAAPFEVAARGLGWFPERGEPRVLWVGLEPRDPLVALRRAVQRALRRAGVEPEKQAFRPHVTLARLKEVPLSRMKRYVREHHDVASAPFPVDEFRLCSSVLGTARAHHRCEAIYPLRGTLAR